MSLNILIELGDAFDFTGSDFARWQRMTDNDNDQRAEDVAGERTSAFRADFTKAQEAAATAGAEGQLFGAEALPQGSGLLMMKRGPNAGSRFLLDRATTTAGRHPNSNIFLDHCQPPACRVSVRKRRIPGCRRR
ncbi:MAG: hypothetical protein QOJ20_5208 [Mycobacterium sp.]|nr:hypothetical protein [Mycobacterium sp.]